MPSFKVSLLDYGAGNVRSVRNALLACGYEIEDITEPSQIAQATAIVFPGVGSYGSAMKVLRERGYDGPLREYLSGCDRPFLGICLGMQTLFESSDEHGEGADAIPGLGVIPGRVIKFDDSKMAVPHIGWNGRILHQESPILKYVSPEEQVYFVHSYYAPITDDNKEWVLTSTSYAGQSFVSSVQRGSVVATQFHPEKSGTTGLHVLKGFLEVSWTLAS
jgi:imidazole glycerol-phosphate synthase